MTPINLIPIHRRNARRVQRHLCMWIAGGSMYVAVLLVVWCISTFSLRGGEKAAQKAVALEQQIAATNDQRSDLRGEIDQAHHVLAAAERVSRRADWSILMAVVSQLRGSDVVLREMSVSPAKRPTDEWYELRMTGFGRTQSAVSSMALRLEQSGMFSKVTVLGSRREPFAGATAIGFEIACVLSGMEVASP